MPLEIAHLIDIDAVLGTEDLHHQRQAHAHFGGGHRHHKEDGKLAYESLVISGKGDEYQVGSVEHQLQRHKDHQRIPPHQHPYNANDKHDCRKS